MKEITEKEIKEAFSGIEPSEELLEKTKAMLREESAKRSRAKFLASGNFMRIGAACVAAAAMLVLSFSFLVPGTVTENGTFSAQGYRTAAEGRSYETEITGYSIPVPIGTADYKTFDDAFIAEMSSDSTRLLKADVSILENDIYSSDDGSPSFCLTTVKLTDVALCVGSDREYRKGDIITVMTFLSDGCHDLITSQSGDCFTLYLSSLKDGTPQNAKARKIGFTSIWELYSYIKK